jgi:CRISPR-associated endoribonuclease Cas6
MMSKYPAAPHPFIIEPPLEDKRYYAEDDMFNFNLILVGKGIDYLPYFIYAFEETGKNGLGSNRHGKYTVESVVNHNLLLTNGSIIYEREKKFLESPSHIITAEEIKKIIDKWENINSVKLNFLTPTRVKYEEKLVDYLEFHMFMRNFLRRLSSLCYFHCGFELELDYKEIIERAKSVRRINSNLQWLDWERYSSRQKTKMTLGGFTGDVTYTGDLREFTVFILLGKYLHIGSAASFGMGKYEVRF